MGYEIAFDNKPEIVTVKYSGAVTLDERLSAVNDVCVSYATLNPLRILIEVVGLDMQLTLQEQKYFGAHLAANPGLRNAKVAVLHEKNNNPNIIVDSIAFVGGYRLAQFENKGEAHLWLAGE